MKTKSMHTLKLLIIMSLYTLTGCSQDTMTTPTVATIYDGCCGTEPKIYEVEDYKVYIPNIITPNNDGINDAFYPICNKMEYKKFAVANYEIYNDTGKVIFVRFGLDITDAESWSFRGIGYQRPYKPRNIEQIIYTGKFSYSFIMAFRKEDGTDEIIEVKGEGCVVRCDDDAHIIKSKEGCYFPVQGVGGLYDSNISNGEDDCFK